MRLGIELHISNALVFTTCTYYLSQLNRTEGQKQVDVTIQTQRLHHKIQRDLVSKLHLKPFRKLKSESQRKMLRFPSTAKQKRENKLF